MELELLIYFHSDETRSFDDLGIDYSVADCESRLVTFYSIDAVGVFKDVDKKEYCKIFACGDSFIAVDSLEEVKRKIRACL